VPQHATLVQFYQSIDGALGSRQIIGIPSRNHFAHQFDYPDTRRSITTKPLADILANAR